MTIALIHALEILDSRGNPTLKVTVKTQEGAIGQACVPSGASTGDKEALELRDLDPKRFKGKGVLKAIHNVNGPIFEHLKGKSVLEQKARDYEMIALDGTPTKARLGANAILGVSLAIARAAAAHKKEPLYLSLGGKKAHLLPCPMMNILNGGAHADNSLDFQEFMIRPHGAPNFKEAVRWGVEIFHTLKSILKKKGLSISVGDEGGFAPNLRSNEEALDLILQAIHEAGLVAKKDVSLAMDPAASEFYEDGFYVEKKKEKKKRSTDEQIAYLKHLVSLYPIDTIEDGLDQNDWTGWCKFTKEMGSLIQIIGDDIYVTNTKILQKGITLKASNSILIKPNQIGTLTETHEAIEMAKKANFKTVLSHRSGETEDAFLADLAVAYDLGQIKTGSLCRGERTAKYNRLIEIEDELGKAAKFWR